MSSQVSSGQVKLNQVNLAQVRSNQARSSKVRIEKVLMIVRETEALERCYLYTFELNVTHSRKKSGSYRV